MQELGTLQPYLNETWVWIRANPLQGLAAAVGFLLVVRFGLWLLSIFRIGS